jgi:hypothetical protein
LTPDYRGMIDEMRRYAQRIRPEGESPFRLAIGTSAYARLREILDRGADPGLPNAWGSAPRSLLIMSGLPIIVEEKWPPNLWAVLDRKGNAIQGGILNSLPEAGPTA